MIPVKRVKDLAQQGAGLGRLEEFLDRIGPDVLAIEAEIAEMQRLFDRTPDPIARLPLIGIGVDWFRRREDDHRRMMEGAAEALRQLDRHRAILGGRTVGRRNRKVDARHRAALERLEHDRAVLADFVETIPRAREWIQNVLPTLLPDLGNGLGCLMIDVTP